MFEIGILKNRVQPVEHFPPKIKNKNHQIRSIQRDRIVIPVERTFETKLH